MSSFSLFIFLLPSRYSFSFFYFPVPFTLSSFSFFILLFPSRYYFSFFYFPAHFTFCLPFPSLFSSSLHGTLFLSFIFLLPSLFVFFFPSLFSSLLPPRYSFSFFYFPVPFIFCLLFPSLFSAFLHGTFFLSFISLLPSLFVLLFLLFSSSLHGILFPSFISLLPSLFRFRFFLLSFPNSIHFPSLSQIKLNPSLHSSLLPILFKFLITLFTQYLLISSLQRRPPSIPGHSKKRLVDFIVTSRQC